MNPANVADWLSCHPEFFNDHPELLTELRIRVPRDGIAIPLIERQVLALKDRARQLNTTMSRLMAYGEANDEIVSRTHRLTLGLLRSHSVADAVAALEASLARDFVVPAWALKLWHPDAARHGLSAPLLPMSEKHLAAPYCGHYVSDAVMGWLPDHTVWQSFALMALKDSAGEPFGVLLLASDEDTRFSADMETALLADIGELLSAALERLLPGA